MKCIIKHNEKIESYNYGGKANSLLKLVSNGINIPKFFILSSHAYQSFLEFNQISLAKNYQNIKESIDKAIFPEDLKEEIYNLWDEYHFIKASIRSSASNEDGHEKSFAGQYETFLNIEKDNLLKSIKNCWKSLYGDHVLAYNNDLNTVSMNIIIEEMIDADYSGVAFSIDPTSNSKNYSVIEVVKGLGEQLVSGSVTPSSLKIRRQTGRCDFCSGNIKLDDKTIFELEKMVLKIEKIYDLPIDIEWCILKNSIYILQARPITAFNDPIIPYKKVISREKSIIEAEIYYRGEYEGIKSLTNNLYYFNPLFIYDSKKGITNVYYNEIDLEEDPNNIYFYMQDNFNNTKQLYNKALESCKYLNTMVDNDKKNKFNYEQFIDHMLVIYPFTSLGNLAGYFENISSELRALLIDFRNNYDYILYKANEYLLFQAKERLPKEYQSHLKFLFIEEIFKSQLPSMDIIKSRRNGYIYFNNKLELVEDIDKWLKKRNITIQTTQKGNGVKGSTAYAGVIKGKVCQVFKKEDFEKFEKGDILVTTMTTPKFTSILKIAGAIVTDEGGLTCHASIIARELKVPCIIGCKNATEFLKDGMIVEVNANEGIVNIISSN